MLSRGELVQGGQGKVRASLGRGKSRLVVTSQARLIDKFVYYSLLRIFTLVITTNRAQLCSSAHMCSMQQIETRLIELVILNH